ncbi:MAG: transcription termination factor NusA [Ruminococcus sp.]|uniref:transcription termination factor NusA n=1 Tax=Ruminococcus TaxID=1263 RepID=UPI00033DC129|nr:MULTISPECIES: transcription termination factor NusA [Ruminococcus]MCB5774873.1 transcription termination factor NusA [Ruminococcus callidus]MCC2758521.1 transcription termination factor NusA [Ruminococcus callidus]MEE1396686.1 transcription termination factor NusA [Ruminococcus sp.]CDE11311.1 transcription termination factor NusA [Ruminococcus sp. CAG:330]
MANGFFEELSALGSETNVDTDLLVEKVKSAMLKAARKVYPNSEENLRVTIDPLTKTFEMYLIQNVVEGEPADENEINLAEARTIDPAAYVGGTVSRRLDIAKFGRAAAQSAKQSIKGDLREINRERILGEFQHLENDCITCEVKQVEAGGTVTLLYHNTELYLFRNEQIPNENLHEGQLVKVYITTIANKQKKPIIKISRARKELVKRLFELEIPEIYDGTVEIKAISREAGSRTKVAVWSRDPNVDAVGACIGKNNARIRAIVGEFGDLEKIDIIPYSEVPEEFIASALAPAKVLSVTILDSEEKTCTVVVPNDQLSLAIGNRGQNVKLAVKLTGYKKIDIKPEFSIEPEKTEEAPAAPAEPLDAETEASLMEESDLGMTEEPAAETPATEANGIEE